MTSAETATHFLVYSRVNEHNIKERLGTPEYSYYLVLRQFLPVLGEIGKVTVVHDPAQEADGLYEISRQRGEQCLLLSFTPPHTTPRGLRCPVIPVFAWEFSSIPDEDWQDGRFNDWASILRQCGAAITHSSFSVNSVRAALGDDFPVACLPAPLWDNFASLREKKLTQPPGQQSHTIALHGHVLDSRPLKLKMPAPAMIHKPDHPEPPVPEPEAVTKTLPGSTAAFVSPADEPVPADSAHTAVESQASLSQPSASLPYAEHADEPATETPPGRLRRLMTWHKAELLATQAELELKEAELQQKEKELRLKESELQMKQSEIETLQDLVRSKEAELLDKQREIYELGGVVRSKEAELAAKQDEIYQLSAVILRKEAELAQKQRTIDVLENRLIHNGIGLHEHQASADHQLMLDGVIYTSIFNPADGRKNWRDMLTAFCTAMQDNNDATLVFKVTHHHIAAGAEEILECLQRLPAFRCRVVVLWGYLDQTSFDELIMASTFVLNASSGEGQCMPLMELMSCGTPAVAPINTAMADYLDSDNAFIVASDPVLTFWQHDARRALRTFHYPPRWSSLVDALKASYDCVKQHPARYATMQQNAVASLHEYCSRKTVTARLRDFMARLPTVQDAGAQP